MSNNLFINSNDSSHLFCSSTNEYTEQLIHRRINFTQTKFNKHLQYLVDYVTCLILQVNNVRFLSKMIFYILLFPPSVLKLRLRKFPKISENSEMTMVWKLLLKACLSGWRERHTSSHAIALLKLMTSCSYTYCKYCFYFFQNRMFPNNLKLQSYFIRFVGFNNLLWPI